MIDNSFLGIEPLRTLAAILESSEDAIVAMDLDGVIRIWNGGAARLYGYTAEETVGGSIARLAPSPADTEWPNVLARIGEGQAGGPLETVRVTKGGRVLNSPVRLSFIRDREGRVIGVSTIVRDVSDRTKDLEHLRDSETRLRSILESAVDGILVIDAHGRVETFNRAAERLFGYAAAEVVGRNVNMLMPSPYREEHDGYIANYFATGVAKIIGIGREVSGRRKDGSTFPLYLSVGEMSVAGERKFTGFVHDLSARVKVEEKLREQAALVRLGEMASVIAHEVKNPLAAVRGAIQVIGKRLPPGGREASVVGDIIERIDGLNQLVNDLLLFARPPRPKPAAVDVAALISATARLIGEETAHREVSVVITGSAPTLLADAELLKIVFLNLFINSAHAMRGSGVITVSLTPAEGALQIAVSDTGPGIPSDVLAKLFTPFFTTKSRGTGLGLSTVKRLVEAHGGDIRVECPPGGGTAVSITLPGAPPRA